MIRFDLRNHKDNFYDRMIELIDTKVKVGEVVIFMFEIGDFSSVQKSADTIKEAGHELMNSLKFNEVDWTIVVKKMPPVVVEEAEEDETDNTEDLTTEEKDEEKKD
jgi:NADH-quinone oxidoreductase subunit E